jgi:hypothetical protein
MVSRKIAWRFWRFTLGCEHNATPWLALILPHPNYEYSLHTHLRESQETIKSDQNWGCTFFPKENYEFRTYILPTVMPVNNPCR